MLLDFFLSPIVSFMADVNTHYQTLQEAKRQEYKPLDFEAMGFQNAMKLMRNGECTGKELLNSQHKSDNADLQAYNDGVRRAVELLGGI